MTIKDFIHHLLNGIYATGWIEWIAVVAGLVYIVLAVRQNQWCWPFGILSSALYVYLNYTFTYYWDTILQTYYCIIGVYGWWLWIQKNENQSTRLVIRHTPKKTILILGILLCLLAPLMGYLADVKTDSSAPYTDGTLTALSFVATWMTTRKFIENWILWIVIDLAYIPLYLTRQAELTAVLFLIYAIFAAAGYFTWRKQLKA
jgi:nicotinamide mononucleotide transporter